MLIVLREHVARIGVQVIEGAPDLVVEVLSPGAAKRDLVATRAVYQAAGVPEYWIVDPVQCAIEGLELEDGAYARWGFFRCGDALRSRTLSDLAIEVSSVIPAS